MWTSISVQRLNGIGNSPSCSILKSLLQGGAFGRGVPSSTSSRILARERKLARRASPTKAGELEWPSDSPTDLVELASTATHTRHSTWAGSRSGASLSCWIVILNERPSKRCATNGLKIPFCFHCPITSLLLDVLIAGSMNIENRYQTSLPSGCTTLSASQTSARSSRPTE